MRKSGVTVEDIRMTGHTIAFGKKRPQQRERQV